MQEVDVEHAGGGVEGMDLASRALIGDTNTADAVLYRSVLPLVDTAFTAQTRTRVAEVSAGTHTVAPPPASNC